MKKVYHVNRQTKALIIKNSSYYQTKILEHSQIKRSIHNVKEILAKSCIEYGSGIEGRKTFATSVLGTRTNLPITVSPEEGLFMLPTASLDNDYCVCLSYYHIDSYEQRDQRICVRFRDETNLYINASLHTFNMQMKKTAQIIAAYEYKSFWNED